MRIYLGNGNVKVLTKDESHELLVSDRKLENGFVIVVGEKKYFFKCDTRNEMLLWVDTLRSTIQKTTRKDEVPAPVRQLPMYVNGTFYAAQYPSSCTDTTCATRSTLISTGSSCTENSVLAFSISISNGVIIQPDVSVFHKILNISLPYRTNGSYTSLTPHILFGPHQLDTTQPTDTNQQVFPFRCSLSSPQLYQGQFSHLPNVSCNLTVRFKSASVRCSSQRISALYSRLIAAPSHAAGLNACDRSSFFAATVSNSSLIGGGTELPYVNLQLTVVHKSLMICCDSDLLPYSTVRLCAFQHPSSQLLSQELIDVRILFSQMNFEIHLLMSRSLFLLLFSNRNNWRSEDCIVLSFISEAFAYRLKEEAPQMDVRNGSGFIYSPRDGIMTASSCHGGLADQVLKSSLLLGQSRTPLLLSIFSSFLLQDLLLFPSYPHHWFIGLLLLHMNPPVLEIMSLMETLIVDCCVSRGYASVGHVMCHEFIDSIPACLGSSLMAQNSVHFHVSRHSLRPDPSQPYGDGLNEIMISEAEVHTTEDSCQLCQRINDSFLVLMASTALSSPPAGYHWLFSP
ncbi:hypothetical protein T03_11223 [Trichinella britovi]|uniref:PH domain-containing protein n=1 Tax=Trichinella britovi TaxID=45882 RepID=A0A0V1CMS1_TRIBR|nr:hypothetical protein T03_11223 [Trichinella britovi]